MKMKKKQTTTTKKHEFYDQKQQQQQQKQAKKYVKAQSCIHYSKVIPMTCDITCSKLLRDAEKITDQ